MALIFEFRNVWKKSFSDNNFKSFEFPGPEKQKKIVWFLPGTVSKKNRSGPPKIDEIVGAPELAKKKNRLHW